MEESVTHVILAGGRSTRLYPIASPDNPKQFLNLIPGFNGSMLQYCYNTFKSFANQHYIVTLNQYKDKVEQQVPNKNVIKIFEPEPKGTGVQISTMLGMIQNLNSILIITPTDHYYGNSDLLSKAINQQVKEQSESTNIILLAQDALEINTNYGWIKVKDAIKNIEYSDLLDLKIDTFIEKPTLEKQRALFSADHYYYNMGIFIARQSSILSIIRSTDSELYNLILTLRYKQKKNFKKLYKTLTQTSFDINVLQRTKNLSAISGDFGWLDLGTIPELSKINENLVKSSVNIS